MAYTRKNVSTLTSAEKRRFVNAMLEVKRRGEYDEFVRTHIEYYTSDGEEGLRAAHMTPSFLPWHRRFLLELEKALRRVDSLRERAVLGLDPRPYRDFGALDRGPARRERAYHGPPGDDRAVRLRGRALDHQGGRHRRQVPDPGPRAGP
ncbi:hypothetical protein RKD20_005692 [Streptomyces sp. SLBN-8D4]